MELVLTQLSRKKFVPHVDIPEIGTREKISARSEEQEAVYIMRKALNGMKSDEAVENILNMFVHTKNNKRNWYRWSKKQKFNIKSLLFIKTYGIIQTLFNGQFNCRDLQG